MNQINVFAATIIPAYLLAVVAVIIIVGRSSKNYKDFAIAGAKLPWWVAAASMIAGVVGGGTLIGYVGNYYLYGLEWSWCALAIAIAMLFLGKYAAHRIRKLNKYTVSDIINERYGSTTRKIAAAIIVVGDFATFCAMISSFAIMMNGYVGLNYEIALLLTIAVFLLSSFLGGFKGLAWTDVIQTIFIIGGVIVVAIFSFIHAGGFAGLQTLNPSMLNPVSGNVPFLKMFGTALALGLMMLVSQSTVMQKLNACKSPEQARKAVRVDGIITFLLIAFGVGTIGLSARVIFGDGLEGGAVVTTILNNIPQGIAALYAAAVVAAVLTTANSMLISSGMSFTVDIVQAAAKKKMDDKALLKVNRIYIVVACVIGYLLVRLQPSVITWIMLVYTIQSCLFITFYYGLISKKAKPLGAMLSLALSGIAVAVWELIGTPGGVHSVFIALFIGALGMVIGNKLDKRECTEDQLKVVETFMEKDDLTVQQEA